MNFLLPNKVISDINKPEEFIMVYSPCQIDSETDTTITVTRILPPGSWSANIITVLKSYLFEIEYETETYWTISEADTNIAITSWE
jgi:hypothetical protein